MKKVLAILPIIFISLFSYSQTYLTWSSLPASYNNYGGQGLQKTTTTWNDGVANSNETIANGESVAFAPYNSQDYIDYGLVSTRSNTAMTASYKLLQGNSGGPTYLTANEGGVDLATYSGDYAMGRIAYTGGQILYQYSSDSSSWTTFYTSTVAPSGTYYTAIQIFGGTHTVRKAFKSGSAGVSPVNTVTTPVTINTPATSGTLTGSATTSSGTITGVTWVQVSGPNTATIVSPTSNTSSITGLIVGTYVFRYTSTNSVPNSTSTDVTVNVVQVSTTPTASTQGSITIVSPTTKAALNGYAFTPSGTITSRSWTFVTGPNTPTITSASVDTTTATGLIVGTYAFLYTVTNSLGNTVSAPLSVVVINAGTSANFTFVQIASGTDVPGPGRALEQWTNDEWRIAYPTNGSAQSGNCFDQYYRFKWWEIQNDDSSFTWTLFDSKINAAIAAKRKFNFAVMPLAQSDPKASASGTSMSYPLFMHTLMQAESPTDWVSASLGQWVINWNSPQYLRCWGKLQRAIRDHINAGSFNGVPYKNVIGIVDIRGFGNYGEWHTYPWTPDITGTYTVTYNTIKSIIDSNLVNFPNYLAVIQHEAFGGANDGNAQPNLQGQYYALTATNNKGQIGWRRDSWGWAGSWFPGFLESNPSSYGGNAFSPLIMNKWKIAPVTGEPMQCCTQDNGFTGNYYGDLVRQTNLYHLSKLGNGNLEAPTNSATISNMQNAGKAMGYRLVLTGGSVTAMSPGVSFTLSLAWQNIGLTPVYYDWYTIYELRNSSNTVVWRDTSSFRPRLFLPSSTPTTYTNSYTLPATVPAGAYGLYVKVVDSLSYMDALPLAITGRTADGAYLLQSVNIGSASYTLTAGSAQTVQLPTSSASISAIQTGGLTSPTWTQVSGPNTATIGSPNNMTTTVSGLVAGTYTFMITMFNGGTPFTSTTTVTVLSAVVVNVKPVANAGIDQTLFAPSNTSTTLTGTGTDVDGFVASYSWSLVSGPNTPAITSATSATTTVTSLIAGTYKFALVVVDNSGASSTPDTIQVLVNASTPGVPPTANAGSDVLVRTPTTSCYVYGNNSVANAGATIASYAWTKIAGAGGTTIVSPTASITQITGLAVGAYTFRLTIIDNNGLTATDDVNVTVSATPARNRRVFIRHN